MILSFITPTSYINKYGEEADFTLALSHLIDLDHINEYEEAIVNLNKPIYIDNGTFENGIPENVEDVLKKARRIKAEYYVAPDYLYDWKKTEDNIQPKCEIKQMVVCQAKTKEQYLKFYKQLCEDDRVDLIGLSILAIPHVYKLPITESRVELMKDLLEMDVEHKDCHLLGLGSSMKDVVFAKNNCPWIKSNDSSCCFQTGLHNKRLTNNLEVPGGKVKEMVNFELKEITKEQEENIDYNVNICKKLIQN